VLRTLGERDAIRPEDGRDAYNRLVRGRTELRTELLADWTDRDTNATIKLIQRFATSLQTTAQFSPTQRD
jgi:hypothetical protein